MGDLVLHKTKRIKCIECIIKIKHFLPLRKKKTPNTPPPNNKYKQNEMPNLKLYYTHH